MPSGSKVVVQWHRMFKNKTNAGLAYVALSRSEQLSDIYIKGTLEREGIHASPDALKESDRLQGIFNQNVAKMDEKAEHFFKISYLNVRSLNDKEDHVKNDNFIMSSDVIGLGETWLKPGEEKHLDGFEGVFAGHGKGKGVAAFSKIECNVVYSISTEHFSSIHLRFPNFDVIFVYLSSGCNKEEFLGHVKAWIDNDRPTTIMGDFNIDYSKGEKLNRSLETLGFQQLVQEPTRISGSLIDHIYVNRALKSLGISTQQDCAYYSDHDVITLYVPK